MSFNIHRTRGTTPLSELARRMGKLEELEEEARNEADGLKKGELLVKCRMEQNELKKMAQNTKEMGDKVREKPTGQHAQ